MFIVSHPITKNGGRANVLWVLPSHIPTALTQRGRPDSVILVPQKPKH